MGRGRGEQPNKLVVNGKQHSVPLYSDEQTYLEVSHDKQQGGLEGMAGDVRKKFSAREIDDQTPVKVVSSDDNGAVVEIRADERPIWFCRETEPRLSRCGNTYCKFNMVFLDQLMIQG
jgi:hypothetical protein